MGGVTGGEVHGQVTAPGQRGPAYLAKLGVDKQLGSDLRFRLTGSHVQEGPLGQQHAHQRRSRRLALLRRAREHDLDRNAPTPGPARSSPA